jgi:hypothetical protein
MTLAKVFEARPQFEYMWTALADLGDGGAAYQVYDESTSVLLGLAAQPVRDVAEWYATLDQGDAVNMRWHGPMADQREASLWLLGAQAERARPGQFYRYGQRRLLRTPKDRAVDPSVGPQRSDELAFRRAVPKDVNGFEIVQVGRWRAGGPHEYAGALVVTRRGQGDYTTHWLYWSCDNQDSLWSLDAGHYDFETLEKARWDLEIRESHA